ncbi:efflux RND transporter periplasmic adaptor subunit [Mariprofundus sp. KV]|uniref:efflux RND transporter periplasmic adaptor subunit n=1 Tax=Mariprofundus sp. KV TaxID=2608715 RepID=UPI0015A198DD|nr:efflux RND transporter periplasmic adaptor subunit [Mariprofundus sp. KV]
MLYNRCSVISDKFPPYLFGLLLTLLLTLLLCACDNQPLPGKQAEERPVVVFKAHPVALFDRTEALGTARSRESVEISARIAGRVEKILFRDGQQVKAGQVIVRMEQDEEQAQLGAATAQLAEHRREIKRLETLLARKAAARRDLDERKTLATVATSTIKQITARIDELTLKAPFAGGLGIRRISPGAMLQPGTVITTLDDATLIKLDFTIPSTELEGLSVGAAIQASCDALPGATFSGSLTGIDSRIDPVTRSILLRAEIDNRDGRLIPGMLMRIELRKHERQGFMVPEESVTQKQDKHFLTLMNAEGKAEIRPVETGLRRHGQVEITAGLAADELVVVRGMGFVKPGQPLSVSETWQSLPLPTAAGR